MFFFQKRSFYSISRYNYMYFVLLNIILSACGELNYSRLLVVAFLHYFSFLNDEYFLHYILIGTGVCVNWDPWKVNSGPWRVWCSKQAEGTALKVILYMRKTIQVTEAQFSSVSFNTSPLSGRFSPFIFGVTLSIEYRLSREKASGERVKETWQRIIYFEAL